MPYRLRDDLSFCRVDGHLIFLDIQNDRYFRLPNAMERTFVAYLDGGEQASVDVDDLIRRNILTDMPTTECHASTLAIESPTHSVVEQKPVAQVLDATSLLEVFAIIYSTQLQMKTLRLKDIVDKLVVYRQSKTSHATSNPAGFPGQCLLDAANMFRRARLYVPIETRCLLDALSMVKFLARRQLPANIVFGVTHDPFAAHCWVQAGDWVLSDTVGSATTHTPIRVV